MKRLALFNLLPIALLAASGCGDYGYASRHLAPDNTSTTYASTAAAEEDESEYTCPAKANVVPDYDWEFDGSNYFKACPHKTSTYNVQIFGKTSQTGTVCVFPAQWYSDSQVWTKPDSSGGPWSQCVPLSSTGAYVTFENTSFNAFFIVDAVDQAQMRTCLLGGNYYVCPHYSFGVFR